VLRLGSKSRSSQFREWNYGPRASCPHEEE